MKTNTKTDKMFQIDQRRFASFFMFSPFVFVFNLNVKKVRTYPPNKIRELL